MRFTIDQVRELQRKHGRHNAPQDALDPKPAPSQALEPNKPFAIHPAAKKKDPVGPNKTEQRYYDRYLRGPDDSGFAVVRFQPMRLYLSNGHSYRADWGVFWTISQKVQLHEVKGPFIHSRDSRILYDTARVEFPCFQFYWAQETERGGEWKVEG